MKRDLYLLELRLFSIFGLIGFIGRNCSADGARSLTVRCSLYRDSQLLRHTIHHVLIQSHTAGHNHQRLIADAVTHTGNTLCNCDMRAARNICNGLACCQLRDNLALSKNSADAADGNCLIRLFGQIRQISQATSLPGNGQCRQRTSHSCQSSPSGHWSPSG